MRRLHVLLALLLVSACASETRLPTEAGDIATASPYGIPGVLRVWGDDISNERLEDLKTSLIQRAENMHGDQISSGEPVTETVLALSGGGADGAFGAGVLAGWTERGDRPAFDVVSGVSTGAIIALFAFLGPEYDDDLRRFYTEYSTDQLLEPSPFSALTGGSSLSDTSGYNALIDETIDDEIVESLALEAEKGRILLIGTTNLDFARPVIWNVTQIARSRHPNAVTLIRDLVRASSAIPAVFPPVLIPTETQDGEIRDELHVDGGATQQVMVFSPELPITIVDQALGTSIDRKLYVIVNNSLEKAYEPVDLGVLSIAGKAVSSLIGGSGTGDLYQIYAVTVRDDIDFNVLWVPKDFSHPETEAFDPVYMSALYSEGRKIGAGENSWQNRPPNFALAENP
ncbi:MAG: patatin-like phospholipase family protein [Pseudomonadota bacterium]